MPEAINSLVTLVDRLVDVDVVYGDWYTVYSNNGLQNKPGLDEYITDKDVIANIILRHEVSVMG